MEDYSSSSEKMFTRVVRDPKTNRFKCKIFTLEDEYEADTELEMQTVRKKKFKEDKNR